MEKFEYGHLSIPKLHKSITAFQLEYIEELYRQIQTQNKINLKELEGEYESLENGDTEDNDEIMGYMSDEFSQLKEVKELALRLLIVALYSVVEIRVKSMIKNYINQKHNLKGEPKFNKETLDQKVRPLFNNNQLIKFLKREFSVDLKNIANYAIIDELRCINNCIKHSGKVDDKLKIFNNWTNKYEVGDVEQLLPYYMKPITNFIYDLAKAIDDKLQIPKTTQIDLNDWPS